ncbi:LuxR family transcriptional regulator [Polaribacter reichenbachii]|uniref:LuxR family transcriptional regulator n=1 Tax=Polaribacter reichenbachii TaxID=996801 RepID=A0A1B8U757_9FLAO|nr:triple tyrosine motif-containing protein [Polaribacter reichenbachii]APZ46221.1 LuxR family transcriptional regulator [Polaribacter reichenbachii]AUC20083.1 LuxR family transcriptional regulator [Polaribacter reichenbachii]OBY67658.1 LuxR family transcriptional regulator [Polaribacter reichenbachii]
MCKPSILFFVTFLVFISIGFSQELPPINSFKIEDYEAGNQNWAISQADNDFIYVANNNGLLEYNGATWNLYETPNETIMRSVKAYKDKIFTGFYMGFGYWQKNDHGILEYYSIVNAQHVKMIEDEQIWDIVELDGWMLFKSLQRIYLYNLSNKTIKVVKTKNRVNTLSKVDDVIYFQDNKQGLFMLENGMPKLVSNHRVIKENFIVDVFKKDNKLLLLTQENGFYFLNNKRVEKWDILSDSVLKGKKIYSAKLLKDNSFALGTVSDGIININQFGETNYQINQSEGLLNNTVLSVFEDNDSNIWLGLDKGINCVNNTSPIKIYNEKNDFLGTIYTSLIYNNNIYLGTNQGLFYRDVNTNKPFKFIENTQGQVWSLTAIDGKLFCGHDSGTFIVENKKARNIFNNTGTWQLIKIDDNTILQGCYKGLFVLKKEYGKWSLRNKIEGFSSSSKRFVLVNKNKVLVNHAYKGVFKITLDDGLLKVLKLEVDATVAKGNLSSIVNYMGDILYANKEGVFRYSKISDSFTIDSVYTKLLSTNSYLSSKLVHNYNDNKLWFFSKDYIKYLSPGKFNNKPIVNKVFISQNISKAASGYENIIQLENDRYLIGTSNGYIVVDLDKKHNSNTYNDFNVCINKINSFKTDEPKQAISLTQKTEFDFVNNNLEFFYSVPLYDKTLNTKYQYQLEGFNKDWSQPSFSNSITFENISFGDYTFKVRAIVGGQISSNVSSFSFKINKPWYVSNVFVVLYVLVCLSAFYLVHVFSKRYYRKQREELIEKNRKESELKELESSKAIIKLNNDKLRNDIESKNRELATSTMNIIKKNEFLNTIKNELVSGGDRSITKVVNIINKNLNNTDDWKMFQEAFNNADKKFLKKVKQKHPSLTPNDLRLCAYLRLNLSSKEIAPLLNISPRSVEVKRYRLRKKMELPHDSNLTNYILEI